MKINITQWLLGGTLVLLTFISANAQATRDTTNTGRQGSAEGRGFITGGTSSTTRLPRVPEINCAVSTVSFQPGARTIWHAHAGGQIIVVTSGTAWYQEKGKPKQVIRQGESIIAPPGVMHWHGATPDAPMIHTVAMPNQDKGGVTMGEPVTDSEYKGTN